LEKFEMTLRPGSARIIVEWGYDNHEMVLNSRNWARVKRGGELRIRCRGFSEDGPQWEYWNFAGGLDGKLLVEYGDGGTGFVGTLREARIEEARPAFPTRYRNSLKQLPDTSDDKIGSLLAKVRAFEPWTLEKRRLVDSALKAMIAAKYLRITSHYLIYNLTRICQSCQYDIPDDRRGKLTAFRGKRVRMVCVERTDGGFGGRAFLVGPVPAERPKKKRGKRR
jgi:hypothetical protein